ncbi:hypothetical protein B296_00049200 [Ensete ventricosum]|uniref:RING-type E3 ubiquitin transferase n=1 Tax=Ensete ventricosum TaxID=4639 RepID=A0A426YRN3_ENSVE|nr:hypothetical protein B296_00049200 [Ensete ventricosum]
MPHTSSAFDEERDEEESQMRVASDQDRERASHRGFLDSPSSSPPSLYVLSLFFLLPRRFFFPRRNQADIACSGWSRANSTITNLFRAVSVENRSIAIEIIDRYHPKLPCIARGPVHGRSATSLRDYFRHLRELGGHDAERDDEGQERNGARAVRRLPGPVNRIPVGDGNAEDGGGAQGIAGAGQMIRRNAENVAARLEMQAARLEAHVEQMFDGLDDADGAEDVPFDELVGMQGPVFHLVENAITVRTSGVLELYWGSGGTYGLVKEEQWVGTGRLTYGLWLDLNCLLTDWY